MKITGQQTSPRKVQVLVQTSFQKRSLTASVALIGDAHLAKAGATVELELYHYYSDKVLQRRKIRSLLPGFSSKVDFPLENVDHGVCWFRATVTDRHGHSMPAQVIQEKAPPKTPWLGSKEGVSRRVPAPWTPLKTSRTKGQVSVKPWGREYIFDASSIFRAITSDGKPLLSGPLQLSARVNGRNVRWKAGTLRIVSEANDQTILAGKYSGNMLAVEYRKEIDFDGMVRVDWSLTTKKAVRLESLTLEIPLPEDLAKYIYHYPGSWGGPARNARALNRKGETLGFLPFIWLGDEQRGLGCFFESDENWYHANPNRVTEIVRQRGKMLMRLHLVSTPIDLLPESGGSDIVHTGMGTEQETPVVNRLNYTFGVHPTPIKPIDKDAWDYRMMCLGVVEMSESAAKTPLNFSYKLLDQMAAAGVRTVVIFEYWTDMEGHVVATNGPKLKKLVKACHDRGMKAVLYFSFLISDLAPEWRDFGERCVKLPKTGYPVFHYPPQPEQSAWVVCLRSVWQDFLVSGMAKALDDYDADGVYLDGTELPFGCVNTLHGCGTARPDGSVAPTYPIFGVREAMRRIYEVVKSRDPDGVVNVHNSTCMTTPTLGWATSYWDGEQFGQMRADENRDARQDLGKFLPLDAFRAEFMGHQWGIAAEFLCYDKPFTHEEAWGFCLLHDVPVRPTKLNREIELASALWQLMDQFDRKGAEWLPYWDNKQYVSIRPARAYASLYRHPRNGVLAIVTNFGNKAAKVKVQLELRKLKLSGSLKAVDSLTGRSVAVDCGGLTLSLKPMDWKAIWIQHA